MELNLERFMLSQASPFIIPSLDGGPDHDPQDYLANESLERISGNPFVPCHFVLVLACRTSL